MARLAAHALAEAVRAGAARLLPGRHRAVQVPRGLGRARCLLLPHDHRDHRRLRRLLAGERGRALAHVLLRALRHGDGHVGAAAVRRVVPAAGRQVDRVAARRAREQPAPHSHLQMDAHTRLALPRDAARALGQPQGDGRGAAEVGRRRRRRGRGGRAAAAAAAAHDARAAHCRALGLGRPDVRGGRRLGVLARARRPAGAHRRGRAALALPAPLHVVRLGLLDDHHDDHRRLRRPCAREHRRKALHDGLHAPRRDDPRRDRRALR